MTKKSWLHHDGTEMAEDALLHLVASRAIAGGSVNAITKELRVSNPDLHNNTVKSVLNSDACKLLIRDIRNGAIEVARDTAKSEAARLVKMAMEVLEWQLDKKNINAVPIVLKVLGVLDAPEEAQKQDTNITVVMPGAEPKTIATEYKEIK